MNHRNHATIRRAPILAACLLLVAAAPSALGATIVVSKGGAVATIQDGVNAASSGDTVLVKSGIYQEVVVVPAGKDGLTLKAKGKVTIEARLAAGAPADPASASTRRTLRSSASTSRTPAINWRRRTTPDTASGPPRRV